MNNAMMCHTWQGVVPVIVHPSTSDYIMAQGWIKSVSCDALKRAGRKVFRFEGRQIVLFDTSQGIYACNNRCPHEGYPLREGVLDEQCRLT
ncbi:MAG: Rieske 2Fe-2S domain-containing protein, partial [Gammaproteobacteria bacterium]|nr:Rieske 2Fe-2S domain-containing protein [Gammaproteobacteria bacterium]